MIFKRFIITSRAIFSTMKQLDSISSRNIMTRERDYISCGTSKFPAPLTSYYNHYLNLPQPDNKFVATYVWIDGSGINLRSKERVLDKVPCDLKSVPKWAFDGSSTGQAKTHNSDTLLIPSALYKDPFRKGQHVIVLCETYYSDGTPTASNHRAHCAKVLSQISEKDPWFGIEQEYTLFDPSMWPIGWPKDGGIPTVKSQFSYCGVGAAHVAGRSIVDSHSRACLYAGLDYSGSNAEVMKSSWEYQVGPTGGIKAADDLWMGRYILNRVAEDFDAVVSYHPKPMGKDQPGIGCHHNFSTNKMRNDEGIIEIERVCKILCERHEHYIKQYGLGRSEENKKRLTGKFETASYDTCRWAFADRGASVRLQRNVAMERKGFLEDRRPAGDCDPYRVCALLAETCQS